MGKMAVERTPAPVPSRLGLTPEGFCPFGDGGIASDEPSRSERQSFFTGKRQPQPLPQQSLRRMRT